MVLRQNRFLQVSSSCDETEKKCQWGDDDGLGAGRPVYSPPRVKDVFSSRTELKCWTLMILTQFADWTFSFPPKEVSMRVMTTFRHWLMEKGVFYLPPSTPPAFILWCQTHPSDAKHPPADVTVSLTRTGVITVYRPGSWGSGTIHHLWICSTAVTT